ncbi:sugar nucleotide-binding protein [Roseateles violae]|uniref:Sugar nucleotide-binding protein n=1 Tax=Roseateles violae TaxID=3058042 RepID=A0ABT8DXZ7_9BURK|nr:sugar nucleotide-binding protein [Pelomonas sp. PFR6]MDN3921962.1 sugar nucleotide-binding protein [Pelomonas sp. PFR6]
MASLLITGLNGTLAPKLAALAQERGLRPLGWDRVLLDPQDLAAGQAWLDARQPDAIAHLAMGGADWAENLAGWAARNKRPFLFTSTAMVFDQLPDGPHRPGDVRTAKDDYGRYKIACEDAVRAAHPAATITRIGWQIAADGRGNNMLAALDEWQRREGRVGASRAWIPACSFMEDTAAALLDLLLAKTPSAGPVHLDSNAREGHSFDRIAAALRERFERSDWRIEVHEDYRHDQRLAGDEEGWMPDLSMRLPALLRR